MNRRRVVSHTANLNLTKKKLLRAKTLPVGHTELGISRCRARARTPTNQHSCVQQILWRAGWALRGPPACLPRSPPRRPVAAHALFLIDPAAARIVVDVPPMQMEHALRLGPRAVGQAKGHLDSDQSGHSRAVRLYARRCVSSYATSGAGAQLFVVVRLTTRLCFFHSSASAT